jgi:hypothetical protein
VVIFSPVIWVVVGSASWEWWVWGVYTATYKGWVAFGFFVGLENSFEGSC